MRFTTIALSLFLLVMLFAAFSGNAAARTTPLKVVTSLPDYAQFVREIGGDRVEVEHIVQGVQDPHHVRPKPSFVRMVQSADMVVSTGLDLEMWLPTVIDKSGNRRVRSGEPGFVAVAHGMTLLEKPEVVSQALGDVHVEGNPHFTCSPLLMRKAAENIATGLIKNDPEGRALYEENLKQLKRRIDERLFGRELTAAIGGDILCRLLEQDKLIPFLREKKVGGRPVIERLGGWLKEMLPLRGRKIVVYHRNWSYFVALFGLQVPATIEPKPGIPPSAKHIVALTELMHKEDIRIVFAANYFDPKKARAVADAVDAEVVIVPLFVGGVPEADDYFKLVDLWVHGLLQAARKKGMI